MGDPRWVLAVDHGTSTTTGATAHTHPAEGWARDTTVRVDGATALPSVVLSRDDGTVLAGRPALDAAHADPQAAVVRGRSFLATAPGAADTPLLAPGPRPTTAVNVATALIARVLQAEAGRRGTAPALLTLLHPASWTDPGTGPAALRAAGRAALGGVAGGGDVEPGLLAGAAGAATRG